MSRGMEDLFKVCAVATFVYRIHEAEIGDKLSQDNR